MQPNAAYPVEPYSQSTPFNSSHPQELLILSQQNSLKKEGYLKQMELPDTCRELLAFAMNSYFLPTTERSSCLPYREHFGSPGLAHLSMASLA